MNNPDNFGRHWTGPFPFTLADVKIARIAAGPDVKGLEYPDEEIPMLAWPSRKFAGVYLILLDDKPVYIGVSSVSVFGRLRQHAKGRGNKNLVGKAGLPGFKFMYWFCDGLSARQIERYILNSDEDWSKFNEKTEYKHGIRSITMH